MGFNSTLVVLNDALGYIADDKDFGKKVEQAVLMINRGNPVNISAGCFVNAAHVVETHHNSAHSIIAVGGNLGSVISPGLLLSDNKFYQLDEQNKVAINKEYLLRTLCRENNFSLRRMKAK